MQGGSIQCSVFSFHQPAFTKLLLHEVAFEDALEVADGVDGFDEGALRLKHDDLVALFDAEGFVPVIGYLQLKLEELSSQRGVVEAVDDQEGKGGSQKEPQPGFAF